MNRFSYRQQQILAYIQNHERITCEELAFQLNVSKRTILSEIQNINQTLPLIQSGKNGFSIDQLIFDGVTPIGIGKKNEAHEIIKVILKAQDAIDLYDLADQTYTSLSTLERKLKSLGCLLSSYQLSLKREKGKISIFGDELNKRKLMRYLLMEECDSTFNNLDSLSTYFNRINVTHIKDIILQAISHHGYYLEDIYAYNLILNIIIALYRMKTDSYMDCIPKHTIQSDMVEYKIAEEICQQYINHWSIRPTQTDIIYIAILLSGQIKPLNANDQYSAMNTQIITHEFITEIDAILSETFQYFMLDIHYEDYLYHFALHIHSMIERSKNEQSIQNEILENVKKNCPFIYDVSVLISKKIIDHFHIMISEEEIGFISIHIGFLINSSQSSIEKIRVLLFGDDYYQTISHIQEKIENNYGEYVEVLLSKDTLPRDRRFDLIISTKPLHIVGTKTLMVTPFYTMMDYAQVDQAIHYCLCNREKQYQTRVLSSFFHEQLFFKSDEFEDSIAAIRFLSQNMTDIGLTGSDFTESVLKREAMSSTCFYNSFAIPHAIELNAKRTMFGVLISEKGIQWDQNLIHLVLMISVQRNDRKEFMKIYNGIIKSLKNNKKLQLLIQSNTLSDFISLLNE